MTKTDKNMKRGMMGIITLVSLALLMACFMSAGAFAATSLTSCGDITSSGEYVLANDVSSPAGCFRIMADDVTLDCAENTINYDTLSSGVGVNATNVNNVAIKNCHITKKTCNYTADPAIEMKNVNNSVITNNKIIPVDCTVTYHTSYGMFIAYSKNITISNNLVKIGNEAGGISAIEAYDCKYCTITGNDLQAKGYTWTHLIWLIPRAYPPDINDNIGVIITNNTLNITNVASGDGYSVVAIGGDSFGGVVSGNKIYTSLGRDYSQAYGILGDFNIISFNNITGKGNSNVIIRSNIHDWNNCYNKNHDIFSNHAAAISANGCNCTPSCRIFNNTITNWLNTLENNLDIYNNEIGGLSYAGDNGHIFSNEMRYIFGFGSAGVEHTNNNIIFNNTVYTGCPNSQVQTEFCSSLAIVGVAINNTFYSNKFYAASTVNGSYAILMGNPIYPYTTIWNNLFYDNVFGAFGLAQLAYKQEGSYYPNAWNIEPTPGTNIIGGDYISGNAWIKADNTGFSQACTDTSPSDGLCDNSYSIGVNNIDNHPISVEPGIGFAAELPVEGSIDYKVTIGGTGTRQIYVCIDQCGLGGTPICDPVIDNVWPNVNSVTTEGINCVRHQAVDRVGNLEEAKVNVIKIDKSNPIVTLEPLPDPDYDGMVYLIWDASDAASGIANGEVEIFRNGASLGFVPNTGYYEDNLVGQNGKTFRYYITAVDNAGRETNSSEVSTTISEVSVPSIPTIIPLPPYTNTLSIFVEWMRSTDPQGVNLYKLFRNLFVDPIASILEPFPMGTDPEERNYTDTSGLADGQTYTYAVSALDATGQQSAQSEQTSTIIDVSAPVTTKTISPEAEGQNGWHTTPFTITLACSDLISGCKETFIRINNEMFESYAGTIPIDADGNYTVEYYSTDRAGNTELMKSQIDKLDSTPPVIVNDQIPEVAEEPQLTLRGTVTDATSGVASFTINGVNVPVGTGGSYEYTVTLQRGDNIITEVATDNAGLASQNIKAIWYDNMPPTTTKVVQDNDGDGFADAAVLTCDDGEKGSGCNTIYAILDGVQQTYACNGAATCSFTVAIPGGMHTITFYSVDDAQNVEDATTQTHEGDMCASANGPYNGCPVGDKNIVELHTTCQGTDKSFCNGAGSMKTPLADAEVKVFDRNKLNGLTITLRLGGTVTLTKNPKGELYDDIFESPEANAYARASPYSCRTDSTGTCLIGEETTGDYLVIVKSDDLYRRKVGYTGLPKSGSDFANGLAVKNFQFIRVHKKDNSVEFMGGSKTVIVGSQLEVIYPIEAIWDEGLNDFMYPFIFISDSDWELDVCAQVPEGYTVAGIYDIDGNLVSTSNCTQAFVAGETKVVAFEVIKTGSPEQFAVIASINAKSPEGLVNNVNITVPSSLTPSALPVWIVILTIVALGAAVIYLVKKKKVAAKHTL